MMIDSVHRDPQLASGPLAHLIYSLVGSLMARAPICSPLMSLGKYLCFCLGLPWRTLTPEMMINNQLVYAICRSWRLGVRAIGQAHPSVLLQHGEVVEARKKIWGHQKFQRLPKKHGILKNSVKIWKFRVKFKQI
jgi:hypothetical protein